MRVIGEVLSAFNPLLPCERAHLRAASKALAGALDLPSADNFPSVQALCARIHGYDANEVFRSMRLVAAHLDPSTDLGRRWARLRTEDPCRGTAAIIASIGKVLRDRRQVNDIVRRDGALILCQVAAGLRDPTQVKRIVDALGVAVARQANSRWLNEQLIYALLRVGHPTLDALALGSAERHHFIPQEGYAVLGWSLGLAESQLLERQRARAERAAGEDGQKEQSMIHRLQKIWEIDYDGPAHHEADLSLVMHAYGLTDFPDTREKVTSALKDLSVYINTTRPDFVSARLTESTYTPLGDLSGIRGSLVASALRGASRLTRGNFDASQKAAAHWTCVKLVHEQAMRRGECPKEVVIQIKLIVLTLRQKPGFFRCRQPEYELHDRFYEHRGPPGSSNGLLRCPVFEGGAPRTGRSI